MRTYSQNQQAKANVEKQAKELVALEELKAKGRADWDTYQNLKTPVALEDFLKSKIPTIKQLQKVPKLEDRRLK